MCGAWLKRSSGKKIPRIGYVAISWRSPSILCGLDLRHSEHGLRNLGYIEGKNIQVEYRYAEGNLDRLPEPWRRNWFNLNVDVIVTSGLQLRYWRPKMQPKRSRSSFLVFKIRSRTGWSQSLAHAGRKYYRTKHSRTGVKRKKTGTAQGGSSQNQTGSFSLGRGRPGGRLSP